MSTYMVITADPHERLLRRAVLGATAVSIAVYGILAIEMVFNTVDRSNLEKEMGSLYSQVGKLEGDYIARTRTIDLSFAHANGFSDAPRVKFTTRDTVVGIRSNIRNGI